MDRDALHMSDVSLTYDGEDGIAALRDISLTVREGEFVAILGPSGCGKSSLLHVIGGFIQPTSGDCYFFGMPIRTPAPDRGILFQHHSLFPWRTALGNIAYPLRCKGLDKSKARVQAAKWVKEVELEGFERFYPGQLSGGMQQRVALARLFAANPRIFLMDEPFGALDAYTKVQMQELLLSIWNRHQGTVVFVTHDIEEALLLADRVLVMSARPGTIIEEFSIPVPRPRTVDALYLPEILALRKYVSSLMRQQHGLRTLLDGTEITPSQRKTLRVGYVPDLASLPLLTAIDRFQATGDWSIETFKEPNGDIIADRVASGIYDLGMNSLVAAISSAQRERKFKVLTGWSKSATKLGRLTGLCCPSGAMDLLSNGFQARRIGINGLNTIPGFVVRRYFRESARTPKLVSLYHGTFGYALREGFVDAIASIEPWVAELCKKRDVLESISLDEYLPPGPIFVLIGGEDSVHSKRDGIVGLLAICGVQQGDVRGLENTSRRIADELGLNLEGHDMPLAMLEPERVGVSQIRAMVDLMKEVGMLPVELNIEWQEYLSNDIC